MSIFYICGKPGGGKSYVGVKQICEELADPKSNRFIVTNIVLSFPNLAEWCHKNCKHEVNVRERIRILDDSECGEFWCYEPGRKFEKRRELNLGRRKIDVPDFEDRADRGCLYVIDEVHIYFGARDWQATGNDCTFFLSQHRKLQCDVILITQHPEQTDKALRRLAQEYMSMRNLMREPVLGFRLGNLFRYVRTLNSPQSANPGVFETGFVTLKPDEIGKLYDTTAGVGIAGRVAPRSERRGRSLWWLVPPVVALALFGFWFFTHVGEINTVLAHSMERIFYHGATNLTSSIVVPQPNENLRQEKPADNPSSPMAAGSGSNPTSLAAQSEQQIVCVGWSRDPSDTVVILSDGREARASLLEVQSVNDRYVRVFGEQYPMARAKPVTQNEDRPVYRESSVPSTFSGNLSRNADVVAAQPVVAVIPSRPRAAQPWLDPTMQPNGHVHQTASPIPVRNAPSNQNVRPESTQSDVQDAQY